MLIPGATRDRRASGTTSADLQRKGRFCLRYEGAVRMGVEPAAATDSKGLTAFSNPADLQVSILWRGEPPIAPSEKSA
jgi:hypothetical protein